MNTGSIQGGLKIGLGWVVHSNWGLSWKWWLWMDHWYAHCTSSLKNPSTSGAICHSTVPCNEIVVLLQNILERNKIKKKKKVNKIYKVWPPEIHATWNPGFNRTWLPCGLVPWCQNGQSCMVSHFIKGCWEVQKSWKPHDRICIFESWRYFGGVLFALFLSWFWYIIAIYCLLISYLIYSGVLQSFECRFLDRPQWDWFHWYRSFKGLAKVR